MKVKQEQDKHRHHKQPQFFLKGFARVGANPYQKVPDIYVYRKGEPYKDGINPSLESVKDAGYSQDFYAYKDEDGNDDFNTYENILMKDFENPTDSVLEKIRRLEEISDKEIEILHRYVASMVTRGDWWRNVGKTALINASETLKKEFTETVKDSEKQNIFLQMVDERANKISSGERFVEEMISKAELLAGKLKGFYGRFLIAPENMPYLTSDNPIHYYNVDKPYSEFLFPISSKVALSLSKLNSINPKKWRRYSESFWEVDSEAVEIARNLICSVAINEVYYSRKAKWLVSFINNRAS